MATPAQFGQSKEELVQKLKDEPEAWNQWWMSLGSDNRRQIDLSRADLTRANLNSRKLPDADLRGCNLTCADLSHADLTNARIHDAKMCGARLSHANLSGADLSETDLSIAALQSACFKGTCLLGTKLCDSNLRDVDLSEIKGALLPWQLAGADLTGAKLPEPITKLYESLGSVNEISDSAKKLFLALLAACLYSWLTMGTTTDVDLITNRASSPLPIIQTAIPIVGFYIVAPIILLCTYLYFHFYLQKLWEGLAIFPAVFTDGRPLYARGDPWLLNDLVRAHFLRLNENRPFLSYFQERISVFLAWWLAPTTLLLFWARYLRRHNPIGAIFQALILGFSMIGASHLHRLAQNTLRGYQRMPFEWKQARNRPRNYARGLVAITVLAVPIVISFKAINGSDSELLPSLMEIYGCYPFLDLTYTDVSIKPSNWTGKTEELDRVRGANLYDSDLRYARARGVFLVKANLSRADLQGADLSEADMRKAQLGDAFAVGTYLVEANLEYAYLYRANLRGSNLGGAHLGGADLSQAQLNTAWLPHADLSGANLCDANLRSATPSEANLTGANLNSAHLEGTDLWYANLTKTDLSGAHLDGARLYQAEIKYAELRGAKGLTKDMILSTQSWQMAFFDQSMLQELGLPADHNEALEEYAKSESRESFDSWESKWRHKKTSTAALTKAN